MRTVIRSFLAAFSLYSKIPMPRFAWREEDMKCVFCFFPWVGALIGICVYLWFGLCGAFGVGDLCRTTIAAVLPLLITGGFHADGFMDTMDAFCSYRSRERKLEILKDPHIGAFAVIMFAVYGLAYLGAVSEIREEAVLRAVCCGFFLSRCLCGLGALFFPQAKKEGMLARAVEYASRKIVKLFLGIQTMACAGVMIFGAGAAGLVTAGAAMFTFAYYYGRTKKEFGGVTGDTSGYFVLLCEGAMVVAAAVYSVVWG